MRPSVAFTVFGIATLASLPAFAAPQRAGSPEVDRVQLGVVDSGGAACPRDATLTAWAHAKGPGPVHFVIHNSGGGKTGELQAQAVPGAAGTYLATYKYTFKITTDVEIEYMAEVPDSGQTSNWVSLTAQCGPQARAQTTARGASSQPPAHSAPESRARASTGTSTAGGGTPPARTTPGARPNANEPSESDSRPNTDGSRPNTGGDSKPNSPGDGEAKQCGAKITVTRVGALSRVLGIEAAHLTWRAGVRQAHPNSWDRWNNAKERSLDCKRAGLLWNCTVAARPCAP